MHGDFRLDNVLVDDADHVTAVLDWEMSTLGDPLTDLALRLVYGRLDTTRLILSVICYSNARSNMGG